MLNTFSSKKALAIGLLATQLIVGGQVFASNKEAPFRAHSLKKLDVAGAEMVLIQLFLKNENLMVTSKDDHIGVSQKNDLVSFYMDYEKTHPALKEALSEKSYIRNTKELNKLLSHVFVFSKSNNRDDEIISVKVNP